MTDLVRMQHPAGLEAEVPASAVGQHTLGGWVVDPSQDPPPCPSCGRPWPVSQPDEAPAEPGAFESEPPSRRRKTSKESDL